MASGPSSSPPALPRWFGPGTAGVFSLLAFGSIALLPPIGLFVAMLAPLPLIHLAATGRPSFMAWGWVAVGLVAAVLLFDQPLLVGVCVGYLLVAAWPATAVEIWLRRSWSSGRFVAIVTLLPLFVVAGVLTALFWPAPVAPALEKLMAPAATQAAGMLRAAFGHAGAAGEESTALVLHWAAYLIPATAALYIMSCALWLRPRLPLLGLARGTEPFAEYASEEWLPVGFAIGGLGWVFLPEPGKWLAANLLVTVLGLYFVHGMAIILFYLGRRLGANRWVKTGVALFGLMSPAALLFSVLGLTDTFFRLRRGGAPDGGQTV
jgi:hypothetical protein